MRPLNYGIYSVTHSATKYFGGHNDVPGGTLAGSAELISSLRMSGGVLGGVIDPHSAWLFEGSAKTPELRINQKNASTLDLARLLADNYGVFGIRGLSRTSITPLPTRKWSVMAA